MLAYGSLATLVVPPLPHPVDRAGIDTWLGTSEGPVDRSARDTVIAVDGDLAFWHGLIEVKAVTKQGGHRATWWMRATTCLRRVTGTWKIAHEHTSVPFHMDGSFRAAVDLLRCATCSAVSKAIPLTAINECLARDIDAQPGPPSAARSAAQP